MTNFRQVILDLNAAGLSDRKIASQVGVTQPAISRIRNVPNVDPRHSLGCKLLALREQVA